jgi:hypothetical protein
MIRKLALATVGLLATHCGSRYLNGKTVDFFGVHNPNGRSGMAGVFAQARAAINPGRSKSPGGCLESRLVKAIIADENGRPIH